MNKDWKVELLPPPLNLDMNNLSIQSSMNIKVENYENILYFNIKLLYNDKVISESEREEFYNSVIQPLLDKATPTNINIFDEFENEGD